MHAVNAHEQDVGDLFRFPESCATTACTEAAARKRTATKAAKDLLVFMEKSS
jgi:hypothetical protein